jgi:hypothetical protein
MSSWRAEHTAFREADKLLLWEIEHLIPDIVQKEAGLVAVRDDTGVL